MARSGDAVCARAATGVVSATAQSATKGARNVIGASPEVAAP